VLLRRSSGRALTLSDEAFGHNKTQASRNYGEDTLYLFPLLYFALTLGKHRHYCWAFWGGGGGGRFDFEIAWVFTSIAFFPSLDFSSSVGHRHQCSSGRRPFKVGMRVDTWFVCLTLSEDVMCLGPITREWWKKIQEKPSATDAVTNAAHVGLGVTRVVSVEVSTHRSFGFNGLLSVDVRHGLDWPRVPARDN
jgi:hypothetical protein